MANPKVTFYIGYANGDSDSDDNSYTKCNGNDRNNNNDLIQEQMQTHNNNDIINSPNISSLYNTHIQPKMQIIQGEQKAQGSCYTLLLNILQEAILQYFK
uniref:Uncharacterized protein n=1 Tax=viral metagenome TaxID=1070528 RepID=A0A6C0HM99_9ZZZZ